MSHSKFRSDTLSNETISALFPRPLKGVLEVLVFPSDEYGRASLVPVVRKRVSFSLILGPRVNIAPGLKTGLKYLIHSGIMSDSTKSSYNWRKFRSDGGYYLMERITRLALSGKTPTLSLCHGKPRLSPDNGRLSLSYAVTAYGGGDA